MCFVFFVSYNYCDIFCPYNNNIVFVFCIVYYNLDVA